MLVGMDDPKIARITVCPEDHSPLQPAEGALIEQLNRRIGRGELSNRSGQVLKKPLEGGLLREDGRRLYPVVAGIPVLLIDEAIELQPDQTEPSGEEPA